VDVRFAASVNTSELLSTRWSPEHALDSTDTCRALAELGRNLANAGFINRFGRLQIDDEHNAALAELALGQRIDVALAARYLGGPQALVALLETGLATITEESQFSLSFEVLSDGKAMALLPFLDSSTEVPADSVYAGTDTWLSRDQAWKYGLHGKRAIDLGTGTGLVAAFLTSRYESVIATDINQRATLTAQLSRELLPESAKSRMHVVTNDVATGLRPGTFDFVCVNAPWVPAHRSVGRIYSQGGETGFELPRRFILEGTELLAPGGVFIALCAELTFLDGSNPLRDLLENFERRGFATFIEPTPSPHPFHAAANGTAETLPGLDSARHVTVVIHRKTGVVVQ
jgi:methylase of polypeptide subunit release factors